jgi:5'-nucleotidase
VTGLLEEEPDMVVSGINAGSNMGDDILYSGTVAAATEGRFLGLPAIAISLCSQDPRHYDTAARVALLLVQRLLHDPLPADTILNVNIPDLPWSELRGFEATRLGQRHRAEPAIRDTDPRNRPIYWIGPPGREQDAGQGTDFHAVRNGCVSITPIQIDLTRYQALDKVAGWIAGLS